MRRALVTLATGTHQELLDIALPSFQTFADRHGYDVVQPDLHSSRPVSWWKVPALAACLDDGYDEALWVDADVVIVDPSEDLPVPEDCWQALVEHRTGDGFVPNCGVWFVRSAMRPWLEKLWGMERHVHSGWWEQEAMLELLGYDLRRPCRQVKETELSAKTFWLDGGWNVHVWNIAEQGKPRFNHATMWPDRASTMREWAVIASEHQ